MAKLMGIYQTGRSFKLRRRSHHVVTWLRETLTPFWGHLAHGSSGSDVSLFFTPSSLAIGATSLNFFLFFLFLLLLLVLLAVRAHAALMLARWNPQVGGAVAHRLILRREVDTFASVTTTSLAALGEGTSTRREVGIDRGVLGDPVGEGVFTVLDDTTCLLEPKIRKQIVCQTR
jgi:hypothetical protein